MTQEHKDLLLKDLSARLPYKVKVQIKNVSKIYKICTLEEIDCSDEEMSVAVKHENGEMAGYDFDLAKPYLFPLSSMTEEQLYNNPVGFSQMLTIKADRDWENITINRRSYYKLVDWFNKNHFDYRGLIPMGLAIDATGLNIY